MHYFIFIAMYLLQRERSPPNRNLVLCEYLKPKIKPPKYKVIKSELKRIVLTGQHPNADLEAKLNELHQVALYHQAKTHNVQHLYNLLNTLHDKHGINSRLFAPNDPSLPDSIYILQEHLEHCSESHGHQVAPISLLIKRQNCRLSFTLLMQSVLVLTRPLP